MALYVNLITGPEQAKKRNLTAADTIRPGGYFIRQRLALER
ncbi:protein of unknown function [Agrobacterium pusense]|uniref:Uncharacterized protein n=1 Tax=Agrobacterium pusense TaxID=648995 RepID=U4PQ54_9HYPH|nr:protein of unknown function [Agrobacterium pusense]